MRNSILFIIGMICLSACEDIFETDLTKKNIALTIPSDSISTNVYSNIFMWSEVDGAINYNIQIASPSFDNIQSFVLDSNVTATKFNFSLSPGTYEWRVRAQNGSSKTNYSSRVIIITTGPLSTQKVILSSPLDNAAFKTINVPFSWQSIFGTKNYLLEVDTVTGDFISGTLVKSQTTASAKSTLSFNEGYYTWRVKAMNDTSESQYSDSRKFVVDKTAPTAPAHPTATALSVASGVSLTWDPSEDNLSGVKQYELYVLVKNTSDTNKVALTDYYPALISVPTSGKPTAKVNYSISGRTLYWRVRAVDLAGNSSAEVSSNFTTTP